MDSSELAKFLLEQKLDIFKMLADTSMLWWVSIVVFSGTILGGALIWKEGILKLQKRVIISLALIIFSFFLSVVLYGLLIIGYAISAKEDVSKILLQLNQPVDFLSLEYNILEKGMIYGISSFVLVLIAWSFIAIGLIKEKMQQEQELKKK